MANLIPAVGQQPDPGSTWWTGGGDAYGTRPTVPAPSQTAGTAIGGNIGNLGGIYGLGRGLNTFQAQQAAGQYQQNLPGYQGLINQSSGNIQSMLAGQVPTDVVNNIIQGAAERGIMTGSPGSPNSNTALLRALGLTSLGMQQTGEQELTGAIQRTPTGGLFNTSSMLVSPEQEQAAQAAAQLYASGPNPASAAAASLNTARSGLGAGLGAIGAPINTAGFGGYYGAPQQSVYPSLADTTMYGGVPMQQPPAPSLGTYAPTGAPATTSYAGLQDPTAAGIANQPSWADANALLNQPQLPAANYGQYFDDTWPTVPTS